MKRLLAVPIVLLGACTLLLSETSFEKRRSPVVEVVETVGPSVVNISTEKLVRSPFYSRHPLLEWYFQNLYETPPEERYEPNSLGSGTIIDPSGLIITNEHVVMGASRIKITTLEGKEHTAEVIGADPSQDLALLKIEGEGTFPHTSIGRPGDLMIGETVIAIGNPFGLTNTVTTGVVSALKRSIRLGEKVYSDFIQTDASINPGNSGGPLLNINGELIGINTAIVGGEAEGIGFAIPIARVRKIVADLRTHGEVQIAWIGIRTETLSDEERQYIRGMTRESRGILITTLFPDSPTSEAGINAGDIILRADGRDVTSNTDLKTIMSGKSPGDTITMEVLRGGKRFSKNLRASEIPDVFVDHLLESGIGIEIANITPSLRRRYRYLPKEGALVTGVLKGSEAERIGIEPADVITRIQNVPIRNEADMRKALKTFWDRDGILCIIERGRSRWRVPIAIR